MANGLVRKMLGSLCCVLMLVSGVARADGTLPKEGAQCDRAQWGQLSPMVVEPTLACVRGVWKNAEKLALFSIVLDVRDKDGRSLFSWFANNVREGTRAPFGSWQEVSSPVQGPNNALTVATAKVGDWGVVMPTWVDGQGVRVEGQVERSNRESSWYQPFDRTVHPGEETAVATRPDGVTYYLRADKVQD